MTGLAAGAVSIRLAIAGARRPIPAAVRLRFGKGCLRVESQTELKAHNQGTSARRINRELRGIAAFWSAAGNLAAADQGGDYNDGVIQCVAARKRPRYESLATVEFFKPNVSTSSI